MKYIPSLKSVFIAAILGVASFFTAPDARAGGFFGGLSQASSPTITGQWTFSDISSATVRNQILLGKTALSISTFTPTAVTFDDGVTLTNEGVTTLNGTINLGNSVADVITIAGLFTLPSNAAPTTNVTPTAVGQLILNTGATPDEVCFSTGTTRFTWTQIRTASTPCAN